MGQDGGHRHPPLVVVAGVLGLDRGLGGEADPLAAAVFAKTGDFKVALLKQTRVGAILRVLHHRFADKTIKMAPITVAAGINDQGLGALGLDRHGLMAKPAQPAVFDRRALGLKRINLHHPAVFVARQAKGLAQALQFVAVIDKRPLGRRRRGAVGKDRLRNLIVEIFFGAQHGAPRGLAAGAVGEAADDAIPQTIVVAQSLLESEHLPRRAADGQPLGGVGPAAQPGDAAIVAARPPFPGAIGLPLDRANADAQIGHGCCCHLQHHPAQGIVLGQGVPGQIALELAQPCRQGWQGQRSADDLGVGVGPGPR